MPVRFGFTEVFERLVAVYGGLEVEYTMSDHEVQRQEAVHYLGMIAIQRIQCLTHTSTFCALLNMLGTRQDSRVRVRIAEEPRGDFNQQRSCNAFQIIV